MSITGDAAMKAAIERANTEQELQRRYYEQLKASGQYPMLAPNNSIPVANKPVQPASIGLAEQLAAEGIDPRTYVEDIQYNNSNPFRR